MSKQKTEFIEKIKNKIDIKRYEGERRSKLIIMIITEIILAPLIYGGLHLSVYLVDLSAKDVWYANFCSIVLGIILLIMLVYFFINPFETNKDFKKNLKKHCQGSIRSFFNISMSKNYKLNNQELKDSNLFSSFNTLEYDDVIKGTHNGVSFLVEELELRDIRGTGRNKSDFLAFKGIVISFSSNKSIKSPTLVVTKGDNNIRNYQSGMRFTIAALILACIAPVVVAVIFFAPIFLKIATYSTKYLLQLILPSVPTILIISFFVGLMLNEYLKKKRLMDDVKTEDISFDKKFCIYSEDQVEARYLVTPAFMERMKNLETAFGTKKIKCSFFEDRIMFAMSTNKDLFELGSLYSSSLTHHIEQFYDQINSIYEIIDHFKLNERIGL